MKNTWSYSQLFSLLLVFFSAGTAVVFAQNQPNLLDLRTCGFNCTTSSIRVSRAFISDINGNPITDSQAVCTPGSSQVVYLSVIIENGRNDVFNGRLIADFQILGAQTTNFRVNYYFGTIPQNTSRTFTVTQLPFTWVCGETLRLLNAGVFWTPNGSSNLANSYTCSSYNAAHCGNPQNITVETPLSVQFSYAACNNDGVITANFNNLVIGGRTPYSSTVWSFGPQASIPTSTLANPPTITFSEPSVVTLTVTDAVGTVSSFSLPVSASPITLNANPISLSSPKSSDGAITLDPQGGTPLYTYLWTGPDGFTSTSKDISNLAEGVYTVRVTDSMGCFTTESFNLGVGIGLPVTWLGFTGRWLDQQSKVRLDWSTAAEYDASFFEVERSANNVEDFRAIALIPAVGNSQTPSHYSFDDETLDPRVQRYYYRIKQSSGDGSVSFTRVILLQRTIVQQAPVTQWSAFPNPAANNKLTLQLEGAGELASDKNYQVTMYSTLGAQKIEVRTRGQEIVLDEHMAKVPKGLLIVEVRDEEGKMQVLKVMKQ